MSGFFFAKITAVEGDRIICSVDLTEELEIKTSLDRKSIMGRGIPEPGDRIMFDGKDAHLYKDTRTYFTELADSLIKELANGNNSGDSGEVGGAAEVAEPI